MKVFILIAIGLYFLGCATVSESDSPLSQQIVGIDQALFSHCDFKGAKKMANELPEGTFSYKLHSKEDARDLEFIDISKENITSFVSDFTALYFKCEAMPETERAEALLKSKCYFRIPGQLQSLYFKSGIRRSDGSWKATTPLLEHSESVRSYCSTEAIVALDKRIEKLPMRSAKEEQAISQRKAYYESAEYMIRDICQKQQGIVFFRKQIADENKAAEESGVVDKVVLYRSGKLIQQYRDVMAQEKVQYEKTSGHSWSDQLCDAQTKAE